MLKNRGEFTAEQQDKLQVRHQTADVLHDHSSVVCVMCVSHSLTGPSSMCSRTGASLLLIKLQVRHRTADRLHGHTFFSDNLFVHFFLFCVCLFIYLHIYYVLMFSYYAHQLKGPSSTLSSAKARDSLYVVIL